MLGDILEALTDPMTAAEVLAAVSKPDIRQRIEQAAAVEHRAVGEFVALKVRHVVDHGDDDIWLDVVAAMAGSPQPGAAAVERILARAFPDPVRVRITRSPS